MAKKPEKIVSKQMSFKESIPYYILIAPFLILFVLFIVLPILASIVLSFFNFDMIKTLEFNGLDNYLRLLIDDQIFVTTVKNTLIFAVITGPIGFLLAFVLAWFINDFSPFIRTLLSFMFYCPSLVGNAYFIWQVAFSSDSYGYINSILLSAGFIQEPIYWLQNADYLMPIIIIVQLWQSMGVSFLANISGLQNVNGELYEAGAIDGIRNRWQELWYITLPAMQHMLLFSAVMQIASAFSVSAIAVQMAGYPSVNYCVDTIVSYLSDVGGTRYEMGYASAMSVVLFIMMALTRWLIKKLINGIGK
ncbi:MAG: sugar ABC transporter permease [Acutalibacteraceae bacterium]|nr:sugar ABC transporter permease [Acutalibacteraceae bacterium]